VAAAASSLSQGTGAAPALQPVPPSGPRSRVGHPGQLEVSVQVAPPAGAVATGASHGGGDPELVPEPEGGDRQPPEEAGPGRGNCNLESEVPELPQCSSLPADTAEGADELLSLPTLLAVDDLDVSDTSIDALKGRALEMCLTAVESGTLERAMEEALGRGSSGEAGGSSEEALAAEVAALRLEVERLVRENEGLRKENAALKSQGGSGGVGLADVPVTCGTSPNGDTNQVNASDPETTGSPPPVGSAMNAIRATEGTNAPG